MFIFTTDMDNESCCVSLLQLMQSFEHHFARVSRGDQSVRFDFVLLSLLLGNDYIPKLPGASLTKCVRVTQKESVCVGDNNLHSSVTGCGQSTGASVSLQSSGDSTSYSATLRGTSH
jgi:hypothetical protein